MRFSKIADEQMTKLLASKTPKKKKDKKNKIKKIVPNVLLDPKGINIPTQLQTDCTFSIC